MKQIRLSDRIINSYKISQIAAFARRSYQNIVGPCRRANRRLRLRRELSKRHGVHIHFGCGDVNDSRFINVDARPFPHVHLIVKSPMLRAFSENSVDSIYACHVLEHFPRLEKLVVLRRWLQILKPDGRLILSVPDFNKLVGIFHQADQRVESIEAELMGGQDYPGNFHYGIFNHAHLADLLTRAGFVDVAEWHPSRETQWPKGHSWNDRVSLNLSARKSRS